MNLSIRNMNWTVGQMEMIRDEEAARFYAEKMEVDGLIKNIRAFFPVTDEGKAAYNNWVDAGPDDNAGFLQYCRDEWERICAEIDFADYLIGKHMFFTLGTGLVIE